MGDPSTLHKVLHLLIHHFVEKCEEHIDAKKVNKRKIYIELAKRCSTVSQNLKAIAVNLTKSHQNTGIFVDDNIIQNKASSFVKECFQQDLIECALNADPITSDLSNDDLHNILYKYCISENTSISPFLLHFATNGAEMPLQNPSVMHLPCLSTFKTIKENNALKLPDEFFNLFNLLDDGTPGMKTPKEGNEELNMDRNGFDNTPGESVSYQMSDNVSSEMDNYLQSVISSDEKLDDNLSRLASLNVLSWEGKMKQGIPCHLYTTELIDKEFSYNITIEDSQQYRLLYHPTGMVSESDLIHDLMDLFLAIPSSTFRYDEKKGTFQVKPFARIMKLSYESTLRFSEKFVECGTVFHKLKQFSRDLCPQEGYILNGLKCGVQKIMLLYMEYITSVKAKKPTLHMIKAGILENAQLLNFVGQVCGVSYQQNSIPILPKGLGLLSFLNRLSLSCKNKGHVVMFAVLLKYAYSPYLNFLNKWMSEGVCCDPFSEFQISEDMQYLNEKDELYWKSAFTEIKDGNTRVMPTEIEKFSHDILQCGKTIRLLRNCSTELKCQDYLISNPPPPLSLLFSYHALEQRNEDCKSYIKSKDSHVSSLKDHAPQASQDSVYLEKLVLMDQSSVIHQIQKHWNWYSTISENTNDLLNTQETSRELQRCKSLESIIKPKRNFCSGIFYSDVGILFSLSGYTVTQSSAAVKLKSKFNQTFRMFSNKTSEQSFDSKLKRKDTNLKKEQPKSFTDSLLMLLVSDYKDTKEDVHSYIKMTSLQSLLNYNIIPVLNMRVHLIQSDIIDYIMNHLRFKGLLSCLRNTYFLQGETFSQNLSKKLFLFTLKCHSLSAFTDWVSLNDVVLSVVQSSSNDRMSFLDSVTVNIPQLSQEVLAKNIYRNKFMYFFNLEFNIDWPLNIIVHKACISKYSSIFSTILEMEFLCWLLGKVWKTLCVDAEDKTLQNSPQYRQIMLQRFDMHQFVRVLSSSVHQDVGGPLWETLEKDLSSGQLNIDSLEDMHAKYLENALQRCFLTEETRCLHGTLDLLFDQVYKFCEAALESTWDHNPVTHFSECSHFEILVELYDMYRKCKNAFYDWIFKMATKMTYKKRWNVLFKQYLDAILETKRNLL